MLSIFTVPKPFTGQALTQQFNAMQSWAQLEPTPQIITIGKGHSLRCNAHGTPYLDAVFTVGQAQADHDVIMYINTDIIVTQALMDAIQIVSDEHPEPFCLVGQRYDLDWYAPMDFNTGWQLAFETVVHQYAKPHELAAVDFMVFRRHTWKHILPFLLGRWRWDNWMLWEANRTMTTVDASRFVKVIHQNHHYHHAPHMQDEFKYNESLLHEHGDTIARIYDTHLILEANGTLRERRYDERTD